MTEIDKELEEAGKMWDAARMEYREAKEALEDAKNKQDECYQDYIIIKERGQG